MGMMWVGMRQVLGGEVWVSPELGASIPI